MSEYYIAGIPCSAELYHHGVLDQKWGVRRYQNPDGSLTPLGRIHYGYGKAKEKVAGLAKTAREKLPGVTKTALKGLKVAAVKGTYPIRKRHAWMMSESEMRNLMKRYDLETQYKKSKLAARGESLTKKMLDASGKLAYTTLENLAKQTTQAAGNKLAERMFESSDKRKARRNNEEIERRRSEEGLENQTLAERQHRLERDERRRGLDAGEHTNRMANQQHRDDRRDWRREEREDRRRRRANRRTPPNAHPTTGWATPND